MRMSSCNRECPCSSSATRESRFGVVAVVVVVEVFLTVFLGLVVEEVEQTKGLELELIESSHMNLSADQSLSRSSSLAAAVSIVLCKVAVTVQRFTCLLCLFVCFLNFLPLLTSRRILMLTLYEV
jgi:hypothetical protein